MQVLGNGGGGGVAYTVGEPKQYLNHGWFTPWPREQDNITYITSDPPECTKLYTRVERWELNLDMNTEDLVALEKIHIKAAGCELILLDQILKTTVRSLQERNKLAQQRGE